MNKYPMILFLFITLGVVAYLDSPYSFINRDYSYSDNEPVMAQPIEQIENTDTPVTEEVLESKVMSDDGYIIETYREYEVYKKKDGEITKRVPTSNEDTLKYWDYQK
jgi:hypothetical protein